MGHMGAGVARKQQARTTEVASAVVQIDALEASGILIKGQANALTTKLDTPLAIIIEWGHC